MTTPFSTPKIIYQDQVLIILEKPAGLPSTAAKQGQNDPDTIEGWLQKEIPTAKLVHRLDNDTSGLMVAATNPQTYETLRAFWKTSDVVKKYTALVLGKTPPEGEITIPIGHHPRKKSKMIVGEGKTRPAVTKYKTIRYFENHSLLEVEIQTGARHQIRAHLAFLGHPIAGDKLYQRNKETPSPSRHFLHLSFLKLKHPETGRVMEWRSELPKDLVNYFCSSR